MIRLKSGVSLYVQGLLNTDQAVPVLSIHTYFGHSHGIFQTITSVPNFQPIFRSFTTALGIAEDKK